MRLSFESRLAEAWPPAGWRDVVVLVAVSGGADSVALLRGLATVAEDSATRLVVGHFNHRLRVASGEDERFVVDLCAKIGVRCMVGRSEIDLSQNAAGSVEEAARTSRYEFLTAVARQYGARFVVTAHTADDQAETILGRIVRGTGLIGLAGIPRAREMAAGITLFRPLLSMRRSEVLEYLAAIGQSYRDDESNADLRFTRNRLRHELLPTLAKNYNPQVVDALLKLGQLASEASDYLDTQANRLIDQHVTLKETDAEVACEPLRNESPLLVREMLRRVWQRLGWPEQDMSFEKWESLRELIQSPTSNKPCQINLPSGARGTRADDRLFLARMSPS